jgi:hypothetical protein
MRGQVLSYTTRMSCFRNRLDSSPKGTKLSLRELEENDDNTEWDIWKAKGYYKKKTTKRKRGIWQEEKPRD